MDKRGFEGWYFKHQSGDDAVAFIPGRAESGAFVQMICANGSRQFDVPSLSAGQGVIRAGDCLFSRGGCKIRLSGVSGELFYGALSPLRSDIMGPFRFFPMECRHGVISMGHSVCGSLLIDGVEHSFNGGRGYIEKDSGVSFPSAYQWLQCNDFPKPLSIMLSVATIPFCGFNFKGCICAILYEGREFRLATYRGVRILESRAEIVRLSQGKLLLEVEIKPGSVGHELRSPVLGRMSGMIRESCNAEIHVRLWEGGRLILDQSSAMAAYEYVPKAKRFPA